MKLLRWFLIIGVVSATLSGLLLFVVDRWQHRPLVFDEPVVIEIHPGEAFSQIADKLYNLDVVAHPQIWSWIARLEDKAGYIQSGEYQITPEDTPARLLERFTQGDVVRYQFRIREGWIFAQALAALDDSPKLTLRLSELSQSELADRLGIASENFEGSLFPETYSYTSGQSRIKLLREAHDLMTSKLHTAWENRSKSTEYDSVRELLIMASIVEKESGLRRELPDVAQVFNNRLRQNMRLQTDPTVIYGLGTSFTGNLTRAHLRMDTPYNSYVHKGLPPTPISLPGEHAIEAAANPSVGELLYFVARGDGTSQFSTNLADHNSAVRQFQLRK